MSIGRRTVALAGLALSASALGCAGRVSAQPTVAADLEALPAPFRDIELAAAGLPAPDAAILDAEGRRIELAAFAGRAVVLNFWATWCAPCVEEMPTLDRLRASLDPALAAVVAVSVDRGGPEPVARFLARHGLGLSLYLDAFGAAGAFGVRSFPATILLRPDGTQFGRLDGAADWSSDDARAVVSLVVG